MSKIYIAAPFRRFSTEEPDRAYGVFTDSAHRSLLLAVDAELTRLGHIACLPHRDEGQWGEEYIPPERIAEICFNEIRWSEVVLGLPGKSRGVHIELGYAAALGKRLVVFTPAGERESTLLRGLGTLTEATFHKYNSPDDLLRRVASELDKDNA